MRSADRSPSSEKLSDADLDRLLEFERVERERLYRESATWRAHRNRLLCVCLGQGTALHLIDGSDLNDFDVLTFFARSPSLEPNSLNSSFRAGRHRDFGPSRFGKRTDAEARTKFPAYAGRNVDLFAYAIPAKRADDPSDAVRAWLTAAPTKSARLVAEKPVVMLEPERLRVIWPIEAEGQHLRGYTSRRRSR
jgi:hypothetical protein